MMGWAEIDDRPPNLRETVDRRTTVTANESAQCPQPCDGELTLPAPHDHQDTIGAHDRRRRAPTTRPLGCVVAQLAEVVLDVARSDLAPPGLQIR